MILDELLMVGFLFISIHNISECVVGLALQNEGVGNHCGYVRPSLKYHKKQNEPN